MAASTAPRTASKSKNVKTESLQRFLMKASTTIYAGTLVMLDSNGLALPAIAQASNLGVVGVAVETVTSDGSTPTYVRAEECTVLLDGVALAQTGQDKLVYASDDHTVSSTQATNEPKAGVLVERVSATSGWIRIERPLTI